MKILKKHLTNKNKILAVIAAKKNSSRLHNKNLKNFCGKTLLNRAIFTAKKSKKIKDIIISSDSKKILLLSKKHYNKIILRHRSKKLANNIISPWEAVKDCVHYLKKINKHYTHVALIQLTSPLRDHKHLDEAINLMNKKKMSGIVGISETECPKTWMTYSKPNSMADFLNENNHLKKKHKLKKIKTSYKINGAIYVVSIDYLKKKNIFFHKTIGTYKMHRKHSIDIDTKFDFKIAELIKKNKF